MTTVEGPSARRVALGAAVIDLDSERVLDASGTPCPVRAQSFAVLRHLLANPGRVVTKDELMAAVWPGIAVTDDSLVQCIGEIRRALGDEGKAVVETVPRRGYRLAASPTPAAPVAAPRRLRALLLVVPLVLALVGLGAWRMLSASVEPARTPAVAVLPFTTTGADTGDWLGPGVAEDIISMLARSPDLLVVARSSSFAYGDAPRDVREIGEALGVGYVLEGSVRREGDKLRIVAQLEDAKTGRHVWAERFDRTGADPWALTDGVSEKVIAALVGESGEIKRAEYARAWGKDTADLGEYDYYLRGLDVFTAAKTAAENARAGQIWAEGLEDFPDSALLKVKLGWYHWLAAWRFWDGDLDAHFSEADRLVTEALASDGLSPETERVGHWLSAFTHMHRGDWPGAVADARRTVAMAPYDGHVLRSLTEVMAAAGEHRTALDWLATAEPREPGQAHEYRQQRGYVYRLMGRYADSVAAYEGALEPGNDYQHLSLAISLHALGRHDEAGARVAEALKIHPEMTQTMWREGSFYSDPAVLDGELAALAALGLPEG